MGHSVAVCRLTGRIKPGSRCKSRGDALVGADDDGWQVVRRRGSHNNGMMLNSPSCALNAGCRASRPPQLTDGTRARSASQPP